MQKCSHIRRIKVTDGTKTRFICKYCDDVVEEDTGDGGERSTRKECRRDAVKRDTHSPDMPGDNSSSHSNINSSS